MSTLAPLPRLPPISSLNKASLPSIQPRLNPLDPLLSSKPSSTKSEPEARITPMKLAVRFHPMAIALLYFDQKHSKTRIRQIPSAELEACLGPDQALSLFRSKYQEYFKRIHPNQVETIVRSLYENPLIPEPEETDLGELHLDEDLNKVAPEKLLAAKTRMNESFEKSRLRPGQDGYVYDKRAEFQPSQKSDWDEQEVFSEVEDEIDFSAAEATDNDD